MKLTPIQVFLSYLLLILICATLYCFVPNIFSADITFGNSLYFSVVTITTLGYGDLSPISDFGKAIASLEALLGIVLMGVFLFAVTNQLIEKQERKRIDAAKENLKAQYNAWKRDVVFSLLFLAEPGKGVSSELAENLLKVDEFKNYFKEDESKRWYAITNNLSNNSYHSNELIHGLENLQHHIEVFIITARVDQAEVLKQLTRYVNHLRSLRRRDLDEYDDQKGFMRDIWTVLAQWDLSSGPHGKDILLDSIDKI
ncbi:MAG: hypothetical protein COA71_11890 [SAR86 cluster bacterium]|uniref:Potassium channel domain-containing protein n=1 Tax=SAR86 cluster bacterium TaxID=2030880 RepID=A0A2A5C8Q4_9GAMM|nr:two pore domain potassium channel family protein [Gammaproteobacteria bacterium AH-315-E17]PCJ40202.1 MAG: hypothetical protein COA71_11890 [SAR86 cluster bacterium]